MKNDKEMERFCKNIRSLRKFHKLNQKQMAEKLHIGIWSLKKIEKGQIPPQLRIDVLLYIYEHFHYTPEQIVTIDVLQDMQNH